MAKKRTTQNAERDTKKHRCVHHPERYAAVTDKCWECLLGEEHYKRKFGREAERFYKPGGPGYAGE